MATEFEVLQPGALLARVHPGESFGMADRWVAVYTLEVAGDAMVIKGLMGALRRADWRDLVRELDRRQVRELIAHRKANPDMPGVLDSIPLGVFDADGVTCRAQVSALVHRFLRSNERKGSTNP